MPGDVADIPRPPYADGWFGLAYSYEVTHGAPVTRTFQGEDVVVYRLSDGSLRAVQPYCPHLGAHLGGGTVRGDDLICPFHHFAFGPDGQCVRTEYRATPPPRQTALVQHAIHEVNEVIWIWYHHAGLPPTWHIPPLDAVSPLPPRYKMVELASHPQQITENTLDIGHIAILHSVTEYELIEPPHYDGPGYTMKAQAKHRIPLIGTQHLVEYSFHVYGLGAVFVDARVPSLRIEGRITLPITPITAARVQLRYGVSVRVPDPLRKVEGRIGRMLVAGMFELANRGGRFWLGAEASADCHIWHYQKYQTHPRLTAGDSLIGPYRSWTRQFYPTAATREPIELPAGRLSNVPSQSTFEVAPSN